MKETVNMGYRSIGPLQTDHTLIVDLFVQREGGREGDLTQTFQTLSFLVIPRISHFSFQFQIACICEHFTRSVTALYLHNYML